ncbi:ATP-binding cassette domain-containing protein [Methylococcaceae bacterium WWC4]|nr:ATP-binding cassette domain-containing protein [Methylococcaceae bacterium WWC4]
MSWFGERCWLVPEVVQTSAMDCGPAALKSLLEGFRIPVSYGRLREACQTNVDGTSIDMLELVANRLGLQAEQVMVPVDHVFLSEAAVLPAMVVAHRADGSTHFVVVWRRHGDWLQVMDPAVGRRWLRCKSFAEEILQHKLPVSADNWRAWAASAEFVNPLRQRLAALGAGRAVVDAIIDQAEQDPDWLGFAKLDAGLRLASTLQSVGGIGAGAVAVRLLRTVLGAVASQDLTRTVPAAYWSVAPYDAGTDEALLLLHGAVLLQIRGRQPALEADPPVQDALEAELTSALNQRPVNPERTVFNLLKADGLLSPLALLGALTVAVAAVLLETLLFRGVFDIAWELKAAEQRLGALCSLLAFVTLLLSIEVPIAMETLRYGRHLEIQLRMALLRKLPRLPDRYFQSRPVSDMAERSHAIALTRQIPGLAIQFMQTLCDLCLTLIGILLLDRAGFAWAALAAGLAVAVPLFGQAWLNERDLRVRNHTGAMIGFYLDALLGLVPIRTHRAEPAVRREHEGLLVDWALASRGLIRSALTLEAVQGAASLSAIGVMLCQHFIRTGSVTGSDLLLVYWALKLPALGQKLTTLAHQYPAQRNSLLRLLEPLATPEEADDTEVSPSFDTRDAVVGSRLRSASEVIGGSDSGGGTPFDSVLGWPFGLEDGALIGNDSCTPDGDFRNAVGRLATRRNGAARRAAGASRPSSARFGAKLPGTSQRDPDKKRAHRLGGSIRPAAIRINEGHVVAAGHDILLNVDLSIAPGEHIAIVGPSGAGKSSLVGLLLGWHRLAAGRLLVDGKPLSGKYLAALRRQTAWLDPAVQLWNRSFLENLTFGAQDGGFDRIGEAIDAATLRPVLQNLPAGLQAHLGESGALLSGGEGQRVRLARALMQTQVRLALLDEPFRGMDRAQRRQLLLEARQWWRDATLLCVTHDVEETLSFERVLVVENGAIVEDAAPRVLAGRDSRYREMLNSERRLHDRLWQGKHWRRLAIANRRLSSDRAGSSA